MGQQEEMFVGPWDSKLDALKDDVKALGGSKDVGSWFWHEKSPEAQRNNVNDRLNSERRERFSDEQEQLIMRRAKEKRGYSAALWYLCDVIGAERPKPIKPEDEQAKAMRAFVEAADGIKRSVEQLERLGVKLPLNFRGVG